MRGMEGSASKDMQKSWFFAYFYLLTLMIPELYQTIQAFVLNELMNKVFVVLEDLFERKERASLISTRHVEEFFWKELIDQEKRVRGLGSIFRHLGETGRGWARKAKTLSLQ